MNNSINQYDKIEINLDNINVKSPDLKVQDANENNQKIDTQIKINNDDQENYENDVI